VDNNLNVHFSTGKDDWETPQELFAEYNNIYGFGLDACANEVNAKCNKYFSEGDCIFGDTLGLFEEDQEVDSKFAGKDCIGIDGLKQSWDGYGSVWCNPPYSKLKVWIKKAYEEHQKGVTVVMLLPARTDTIAWHEYIFSHKHVKVEFLRGRLKFSNSKNSAPFPSAIVVFDGKQRKILDYICS
jgi:hypothetical protein